MTVPEDGGTAPPPPGEAERKRIAPAVGVWLQPDAPSQVRVEPPERHEARRRRAIVRGALRDAPRASPPPVLVVPFAAVLLAFLPLLAFVGVWSAAGLSLVLLAILGFPRALGAAEAWLLRVERDWLRALPFPVRGYFRVLGGTPAEERRLRVRIRFRGAAPDREVMEGFLRRVHVPATAHLIGVDGSAWTAESGPIRTMLLEDGSETNVSSLSWMRSVIDEALLPLHAAYPLRGVEFSE
ncbi:MAG TPA: hypothetical protein VFR81_09105 [Longimicrobium sp.]|nr:hypothetical protein [Longimicrobium sp.]